jgi:ribonuclease HI
MELTAAIEALKLLKSPCSVRLFSDSQYLVNAINQGWAERWRARGWMRNKKDPALNPDLWEILLELLAKHQVTLVWVKGHAGVKENERCDELTHEAINSGDLAIDSAYESTS